MKKIKTLYIFNREIWPELLTQKDELSKVGQPDFDYSQSDQLSSNFNDIPFDGSFIPWAWLAENILPMANSSHDQIVFHIPTDQWKGGDTNAFTLEGHGRPTIICVHSHQGEQLFGNPDPKWKDRGFYERTQHEFAHAICDILGIQDYIVVNNVGDWQVHIFERAGNLWKQPWLDFLKTNSGTAGEDPVKTSILKSIVQYCLQVIGLQKKLIIDQELVNSIIRVESGSLTHPDGYDNAFNANDVNGPSYGCMQIHADYLRDANEWMGTNYKLTDLLGNRILSVKIFHAYMARYATEERIGRPVTSLDIARIHNGGPDGWRNPATIHYGQLVEAELLKYPPLQ